MPLALIFSLDYELFRDGSGNVGRKQIAPTNALLDVFDQFFAKLSLFLEYGQYMGCSRFASPEDALPRTMTRSGTSWPMLSGVDMMCSCITTRQGFGANCSLMHSLMC